VTLAELPAIIEPEETGETFADNALLKARYYAEATGLPTVAEDSGLVIDALGGRPGVQSARYPGQTYADKFENLYRELAPYPRPWSARFVCSLAFVEPVIDGQRTMADDLPVGPWSTAYSWEATVEGEITDAPRGEYGFGYDPIFFYPPYGRTLGEVTGDRKLAVAHRGKAFVRFALWLKEGLRPEAPRGTN
jgi:XTP/dITP diphosphohydrolase